MGGKSITLHDSGIILDRGRVVVNNLQRAWNMNCSETGAQYFILRSWSGMRWIMLPSGVG